MESHSPILWIQFAQSHYHLSENKWEAEGRTGWKERHVTGQWEKQPQTEADRQTDRQTEERHEGKFPPVIERRDWQSKCGTKATLCRRRLRIIHPLRSHWKGERGNKRRDERSEREVNSRVAERKWQEEKKKKKDQGEREWAQLDSTFWVNVRKLTGLTEQCGSLRTTLRSSDVAAQNKKYAHKSTLGSENMVAWLI